MQRLFTTWYPCEDPKRLAELTESLQRNVDCPALEQICLLLEDSADVPVSSEKIVIRDITKRPTFNDFWGWIEEVNGNDDIAIIANSDIWFDDTIGLACDNLTVGQCWTLARWDYIPKPPQLFDRNDSQDAWVLRGKPRAINGDFYLGSPRCDNRLIYELQEAGYECLNPAFSVRAYHQHDREFQEYGEGVQPGFAPPPYRYLWPHNLFSRTETQRHNAHSPISIEWRVDPREQAKKLPARAWQKLQNRLTASQ